MKPRLKCGLGADAEGYRQILQRIDPIRRYEIMFDAGARESETKRPVN